MIPLRMPVDNVPAKRNILIHICLLVTSPGFLSCFLRLPGFEPVN